MVKSCIFKGLTFLWKHCPQRSIICSVVILFFDGFVSQDTNARRVYREARRELVLAVAFVARSLLGRAIASFALGGRLPSARRKMFTTLEDALPWVRTQRDRTAHEEEP